MNRAYKHTGRLIVAVATVAAMQLTIEQIGPDAVDRARELMLVLHRHELAVQPALGSAPGRSDAAFWEHYRSGFARWWEGGGFALIAVVDGRDVGFLFATEREGLFGYESSARIGYVEDIAVLEDIRGGGVGRALIEAARERFRARGYSHFELSSVPGNEDARAFYRRLGLQPAAVLMIGDA
jgi:GNAT superfamily N-acetyltransferase